MIKHARDLAAAEAQLSTGQVNKPFRLHGVKMNRKIETSYMSGGHAFFRLVTLLSNYNYYNSDWRHTWTTFVLHVATVWLYSFIGLVQL